jgi:hypothetical protein
MSTTGHLKVNAYSNHIALVCYTLLSGLWAFRLVMAESALEIAGFTFGAVGFGAGAVLTVRKMARGRRGGLPQIEAVRPGMKMRRPGTPYVITVREVGACTDNGCSRMRVRFNDPVTDEPDWIHADELLHV